jgi:hypothetical protein
MRRRRTRHLGATVETHQMAPAVPAFQKIVPAALPDDLGGVFSHDASEE